MDVPLSLSAYTRVLRLASTPGADEFKKIAKISAAGMALIGLVGFTIFTIMYLFHGVVGL